MNVHNVCTSTGRCCIKLYLTTSFRRAIGQMPKVCSAWENPCRHLNMIACTIRFFFVHRRRNSCGVLQKDILGDPRQVTSVGSRDAEALSERTVFEVHSSGNRFAFDFRAVHRRELIRVRRLSTLQCHVDDTLTRIRAEHTQCLRLVEVKNVVAHRERPAQRTSLTVALTSDIKNEVKLTLIRVERLSPVASCIDIVVLHVEGGDLHIRSTASVRQLALRRHRELTVTGRFHCGL